MPIVRSLREYLYKELSFKPGPSRRATMLSVLAMLPLCNNQSDVQPHLVTHLNAKGVPVIICSYLYMPHIDIIVQKCQPAVRSLKHPHNEAHRDCGRCHSADYTPNPRPRRSCGTCHERVPRGSGGLCNSCRWKSIFARYPPQTV